MRPAVPGRPPAWQRRLLRHRRLAAAVLAAVVVWSLTSALRPAAPRTAEVVTAVHDLLPGTTLTADDLDVATRASDSLPADPVRGLSAVVGRLVAFPVRAGESLRERDVVAETLLGSLGPDMVATPVRLSDDATLASIRPGDVVDVLAARGGDGGGPASAVVVAARVRVLTVGTGASGGSDSGLLGSSPTTVAPVLLLATTTPQALDLAAAAVGSRLSVTLRVG